MSEDNPYINITKSTDDVINTYIDGQLVRLEGSKGLFGPNGDPIETVPVWTAGIYSKQVVTRHNEKFWKSTANNNSTEPGASGALWTEIAADGITTVLTLTKHNTYISYH